MKKSFIFFIVLILSLALVACKSSENNDKPTNKDPDEGKEIVDISVDKTTIPEFIDVDEFDLSVIKIIVEYSDGTTRLQDLKEDMLESDALELLKKGGSKRVTITYKEDYACTANIASKDYGANDPKITDNDAIVMIARDKQNSLLQVKVLSNTGISSMQCEFTYDSTNFSLDQTKVNKLEGYDISFQIKDNKLTILVIAKNTTLLKGENVLISLPYSGDYRSASFEINESYSNRVLRYENDDLNDVTDVNYFYSLK